MFLSRASVRRPIAMSCFLIMLVLFGINSWDQLGLDAFPNVEIPYVTVTTVYPGASPAEIEVDVAKRLEDAVGTIDGLKTMNTTCMENVCQITLEFQLGQSVDVAAQDVRERIDKIRKELPADIEQPEISKFDPNATPVITLMLTGDLPVDKLYDYADETLANRLSVISGVAEIQLSGGEPLELRVTLDKEKLTAAGITVSQVLSKLGEANIKVPVGRIRQGVQEINVTYDSEFKDFNDLGALEIGTREKRRIYLRDVAEITMESEEKRSLAFFDGEPGVVLKVVKKGEANAVRVIDGVRAAVDEINRDKLLPSGMNLVWVRDSGSYIRSSVDDAWSSIAIGILLTAVILFAFLHEARSTFIVVISMPVSIVVSFWAMDLCGFTFNIFTLLALGTSVGTLVTNSIVVIENIARHLERGEDPKTAADSGAAEVALPVFASAMTNVVVFGPIAMMGSLVGRFLVPFAVTIGIATLVSLFVSFTLTPILAAILLRAELPEQNSLAFLFRWWNRGFGALERQFGRSIDFVCRHGLAAVLLAAALFLASMAYLPARVGMTFVPDGDQGEFVIKLEFPTDYSLESTLDRTLEVEKHVRELPNVLATSTVVGKVQGVVGQASEGVYLAEITVVAKPKNERKETLDDMRDLFRDELKNLSNCIVTINIPSATGGSSASMELEITGDDLDTLEKIATEKCGIIKHGAHAVLFGQTEGVENVARETCAREDVSLTITAQSELTRISSSLDGQVFRYRGHGPFHLRLLGEYQLLNALTVVDVSFALRERGWDKLTDVAIDQGLSTAQWPGRLELLRRSPDFIVDGAHNPQCVDALMDSLAALYGDKKLIFLTGVLRDKDWQQMLRRALPLAKAFVVITPPSARALDENELAAWLNAQGVQAVPAKDTDDGVRRALELAGEDDAICSWGSLYFTGEVRRVLTEQ